MELNTPWAKLNPLSMLLLNLIALFYYFHVQKNMIDKYPVV
jgi:hypothetical protein